MGADLREIETLTNECLQENASIIKPDTRQRAILVSIERFSKDKAKEVASDIIADGSYDYTLPVAEGKAWVDGFSFIISIEYPAGQQTPVFLDAEDYTIYDNGITKKLRFLSDTPATGNTIRLNYTTKWLLTKDATTLLDRDAHPLAALAASVCMRYLASYWIQTSAPSLDIDVIDYNRKSVEATMLADNLENIYRDHVGIRRIGEKSTAAAPVTAAGGVKDLDMEYPWGEDFLTHPRGNR